MSVALEVRQRHHDQQIADVQRVSGGIEACIDRHRALQRLTHFGFVVRECVHHAAFAQRVQHVAWRMARHMQKAE